MTDGLLDKLQKKVKTRGHVHPSFKQNLMKWIISEYYWENIRGKQFQNRYQEKKTDFYPTKYIVGI